MSESAVVTLRLDAKLKRQLEQLSKAMKRSRSFVAAEAIREYVSLNEWQIAEIQKSLGEAERRDFASDQDVRKVVSKWTRRAR
jgi:predicted transcriptional regulator